MSDRQRLLILAVFHFTLAAAALTLPFRAFVRYDSATVGVAIFAYLAIVTWWITRHARASLPSDPRSRMDAYVTTGVRWGAIGGALYVGGILAPLFLWGMKIALFGPEPHEWALVGEEWAFLWIAAILVAIGTLIGAALGGVIAIIDRTLLQIADWIRAFPVSGGRNGPR